MQDLQGTDSLKISLVRTAWPGLIVMFLAIRESATLLCSWGTPTSVRDGREEFFPAMRSQSIKSSKDKSSLSTVRTQGGSESTVARSIPLRGIWFREHSSLSSHPR